MEFKEFPGFTKSISKSGDEKAYFDPQLELVKNPLRGVLMASTGVPEKLEWLFKAGENVVVPELSIISRIQIRFFGCLRHFRNQEIKRGIL